MCFSSYCNALSFLSPRACSSDVFDCIYGPLGFWGFSDQDQGYGPDYGDPYDPYCMPMMPPRGFGGLNGGYGTNFFGCFQDDGGGHGGGGGVSHGSGGGGGGGGGCGKLPPETKNVTEGKRERKTDLDGGWFPKPAAQPLTFRDTEVLKKPVIKRESGIVAR